MWKDILSRVALKEAQGNVLTACLSVQFSDLWISHDLFVGTKVAEETIEKYSGSWDMKHFNKHSNL